MIVTRWKSDELRRYLQLPGNRVFGPAVLDGILGGGIGAAYLALLPLLQRLRWPTHSGPRAQCVTPAAAGGGGGRRDVEQCAG